MPGKHSAHHFPQWTIMITKRQQMTTLLFTCRQTVKDSSQRNDIHLSWLVNTEHSSNHTICMMQTHLSCIRTTATSSCLIQPTNTRAVPNRFFKFRFSFLKKFRFSYEWVWFGSVKKTPFGLDIIVIYYSRNSKYYSDSGWQLWHHSKQRQVNNVIAF